MSFVYMLFFQQTYLSPGSLSYLPISLPLYCKYPYRSAAHFTSIPYNSLSGVIYFIGALVTNRVLCLVPLVAWFEDWMFVRKFEMLNVLYVTIEVVGKYRTVYINYF